MTRPTAFVTGASYGVGAATAVRLARDGYDVAISATRVANLAEVAKEIEAIDAQAVAVTLDLCSDASIEAAMAEIDASFGHLDLLVNNAAAALRKPAVEVTRAEWDAVMAANVTGTFFLTQRAARHWIADERPGTVVNIASTHGLVGAAEQSTYGISKGALIQMTRMLAIEWAGHGIRVNAVAPGRLDTPSPSRAAQTSNKDYMAAMLARIPLHRLATVEEVAAAVAFLASPAAASITGQILVLDGGLTTA
jgi:NAD(P)-dependent dehydrogenase (short-subunit alcohol dehydrogenase family)